MGCIAPFSSVYGTSQEEYWSGLPGPPPGDLPDPGMEPTSPTSPILPMGSLSPGKPQITPYSSPNVAKTTKQNKTKNLGNCYSS